MPEGGFVAVVAHPQFGRDEHLGAIDPTGANALADLPLVTVDAAVSMSR